MKITLKDKYTKNHGKIFATGSQILVKLPLVQKILDEKIKLNTSGFISGYRGSPLGVYDKALWEAKDILKSNSILFSPGLNEDLAATAVWGSQQPNLMSEGINDGVFSIWYGKGPGVDRSGDAFKHGNSAGTSKNGGVLVLLGDDHTAKSSTIAHQSEFAMLDAQIPVLNPSNLEDLFHYGIFAWALSRYSGLWVSMKCITSNMDSSASINIDLNKLNFLRPKNTFDSVHIRANDDILEQEKRISDLKLPAAVNFCGLNKINKYLWKSKKKKLGIISTGKAFSDTIDTLSLLGIDKNASNDLGIHLLKIGMSWPLDAEKIEVFSSGLDEILIVEEKRSFLESHIRNHLYNFKNKPKKIVGKFDEKNERLIQESYQLLKSDLKNIIESRISKNCNYEKSREIIDTVNRKTVSDKNYIERTPYFCSGCPHNTSTRIPEESKAMAGIGCHFMSLWMNRNTKLFTHMGAEGANWIGMSSFVKDKHIFQNIGDGTYNHSGLLAIRAAVASKVNITYKILYNDAVAMTGGQPLDGMPTPQRISHQLFGEGIKKIALVSDQISKYNKKEEFSSITSFHDRKELNNVQVALREIKGVTVIIYEQGCATEKRRKRKRGIIEDPIQKVFINHLVCEGCGDCSSKSNCISVEPLQTQFGTKRKINQSTCNKDFSCQDGFCPSFITVEKGKIKTRSAIKENIDKKISDLPLPKLPELDKTYNIVVTGIGGTGVVTIGALIGMAAHIENKGVTVLDQIGLAQKGGAVTSHIKIAKDSKSIFSSQINNYSSNFLLGTDLVVSASKEVRELINPETTVSVVNDNETPLSQFVLNSEFAINNSLNKRLIENHSFKSDFLNTSEISQLIFGNSIYSNIFQIGYAFQKGLIPIKSSSFIKAVELNNIKINENINAFNWGRIAANDINYVLNKLNIRKFKEEKLNIDKLIETRYIDLINYQNKKYANLFTQTINITKNKLKKLRIKDNAYIENIAKVLYKTMAYKDEYEVARLYTDGRFQEELNKNYESYERIYLHLSPPFLGLKDKYSNKPRKIKVTSKILYIFNILKRLKFLRNTIIDPFSYNYERKLERKLVKKCFETIATLNKKINMNNYHN
ncbi:MAG: hypothetical protein CFH34_01457, partial [Alphaproteobacteria bacterium MarineAlpha9_Bin4]